MKKKWIRRAAAVLLAAALMTVPCSAATIGGATLTGSNVRLRAGADTTTTANVLAEMPYGAFLLVEERLGGWYRVNWNGTAGFVSADYAAFAETVNGTFHGVAVTAGTDVNLRATASASGSIVKCLPALGTELTVSGVSGEWLKVTDATGAAGYVHSSLVTLKVNGEKTPGELLAETALKYKGYAYVWGGMSPATGFDCSGLANYVCRQSGYELHRVAQDIYSYDGTAVAKADLKVGDLVFFGYGPYCVTHMGIYIGGGQMIHASTSKTGVIVTDIFNSSYYTRMYVGAKRIAE